jgi:glycogen debranching enzyme
MKQLRSRLTRMAEGPRPPGDGTTPTSPGLSVPRVPLVADLPSKVLAIKEGETFLYTDVEGNVDDRRELGLGLYHRDTRFLSHFRMRVCGLEPVLLSSSAERAYMAHVDMTNPEVVVEDGSGIPQNTLSIRVIRAVAERLYQQVRIKNYNSFPVAVDVALSFGADFADIFEVRGLTRHLRGAYEPPRVEGSMVSLGYEGRDGVRRETRIELGREPSEQEVRGDLVTVTVSLRLEGHDTAVIPLTVTPMLEKLSEESRAFDVVVTELKRSYEEWRGECTTIRTDNALFNSLLERGIRDLRSLFTSVDGGGVIAAGIPWYVAVFGRDSLITAHQMLTLSPRPAREGLRVLASYQGTGMDDWRDEEPGKILHEIRRGELTGAGELPHTPYYGSVDSTLWFLIVLAQYFRWTNDLGFVKELLPAAESALAWIDEHGDMDGDGFVEYRSRSPAGLVNQGWKDSPDSVTHVDGSPAEPPIALAEVQGYVYLAKTRMADLYAALGDHERAVRLRDRATVLRRRFNEAFWMEEEDYFAMALDGDKRQVKTVTSNPGHGLYCDIVETAKAHALARRLFQQDLFSGWGIRTLSKTARSYNPMSYHNGTVWPHDNALIAAGLKRYGFVEATNRIATAMFEVATHADYMRLPELFCGFARRDPSPPVEYPAACAPQAWAAGAPFLLLQAMLGVSARANENLLTVNKPHLPRWLGRVELRNMKVGENTLSLEFHREGDATSFSLLEKEGNVRVVMEE